MPKSSRSGGGQLRSHSRSSSSTRLGANLQFTAKDAAKQQPAAMKKTASGAQSQTGGYEAHHGGKPPFVRANSSQRVHSREQLARRLAPLQQPAPAQQQQQQQHAKTNGKNFSIQTQADSVVSSSEDDEDEWESESGAATPNQGDSGSDTASENGAEEYIDVRAAPAQQQQAHQPPTQQQRQQVIGAAQGGPQVPALTAQQQQILLQQRREAEEAFLRQRQLEAHQQEQEQRRLQLQLEQQQAAAERERYLHHQQQQQHKLQQEQYLQQLHYQQQRQQAANQHQQQQQQYHQQQQQQQLYLQQQQRQAQYQQMHPPQVQTGFPVEESNLARVNTARPSDFEQHTSRSNRNSPRPATPSRQQQQLLEQQQLPAQPPQRQQQQRQPQPSQQQQTPHPADQSSMDRRPLTPRSEPDHIQQSTSASDTSETSRSSPRPKRLSRTPSTHSIRSDHAPLRPHPLFRGLTHSRDSVPRPTPLAPLTVLPASAALPTISTSPPTSIIESANGRQYLSSSPTTSVRTAPGSPAGSEPPYSAFAPVDARRMSVSSARSAASTPHSGGAGRETVWTHDRTRTLSTMSTASSSAALSSLANLPTVTRPPSPQTIAFFPPVNPHSNIEAIHPLLPGPYLHNHLTVLARRTPIRESFDRVMRAKNAAAR